jgi:sugar phosphate isomerase/epimerase
LPPSRSIVDDGGLNISRFALGLIAGSVALAILIGQRHVAAEAEQGEKINVGLQLYSFRNQMAKDVPGSLALAQKMGITDVEVAGMGNLSAAQFRQQLDEHGLKATGVHFQWDQLSRHLDQAIADVKTPNYTGHENVENDVALGKGQLDLPAILAEAGKIGVKHYYIEDESSHSVEQVPVSIQYVRSIGTKESGL